MDVKGYYNNLLVNVSFNENDIKVGSQKINADDIYLITETNLMTYGKFFQIVLTTFSAVLTILVCLIVWGQPFLFFALMIAFITSIYAYFIYPLILKKQSANEYGRVIDIYYNDLHMALLVPESFEINVKAYQRKTITNMQKMKLKAYQRAVKASRKYLVSQIETGKSKDDLNQVAHKYETVAKQKYKNSSVFGAKAVKEFGQAYQKYTRSQIKLALRLSRFTIFVTLFIIFYLIFADDIDFSSGFLF